MSVALYESDVQRHHLDSRIAVQVTSLVRESYYLVFCLKWGHKWGQDAPKKPSARVDPEPRLEHTAALLYVRCPQLLPSCQDSSLTTVDLEKRRTCKKKMIGSGLVQSTLSALHVDQAESSLQLQYCCEIMGNPFISTAITICQRACMRPHAWACHAVLLVWHPAVLGSKTHFGFHGLDCRGDSVLSLKFRDLSLLGSQVDSLLYTPWGKEGRNGLMEGCRDLSRSADPWIQAIMTSCKWMPIMSITLRSLESRRPYSRQESRCCILVRRVNTTSQLEMSDSKHAN